MSPQGATPHLRASREMRLLSGAPLDTVEQSRSCAALGCPTVLSRYNPSDVCAAHAGWRDAEVPRRRRRRTHG